MGVRMSEAIERPTYALPPGQFLAVLSRGDSTGSTHCQVHYYEELTDEEAADFAAEIIAHQLNEKPDDEVMAAAMQFQARLVTALTERAEPPTQPEPAATSDEPQPEAPQT